jgi:hypothetical protein
MKTWEQAEELWEDSDIFGLVVKMTHLRWKYLVRRKKKRSSNKRKR